MKIVVVKKRMPTGRRMACHGRHRGSVPRFNLWLKRAMRWILVRRTVLVSVMNTAILIAKVIMTLIRFLKSKD